MTARTDPLRVVLQVSVYIVLYMATAWVSGPALHWLFGYLVAITATGLLAAAFSNWLSIRIYEQLRFIDIGLQWNAASAYNLSLGVAGGIGSACLVLCPPLLAGAARINGIPQSDAGLRTFVFVSFMLLLGSAGEEMLFRGYGFQTLLRSLGPWATILPVGIVFAALHSANPNASYLGLANTAGFGILFGYAFWRSRDIWLPIGLHYGWNFTLPFFGVNVSGIKMRMTGYTMEWTAGPLWSGGEYGPEASLLTSGVMLFLFAFVWRAPIRRQLSPLLDPPVEEAICAPGPPSPS